MDQGSVQTKLADLPIGRIRYLAETASTNTDAANWSEQNPPDLSLVVADHQTAGRGRNGRQWITVRGAALAFSIICYPSLNVVHLSHLSALGALAVCDALKKIYQLDAVIKWPNDILVNGKKLAGILAENKWSGDQLKTVIMGIGINIAPESIAETVLPMESLPFSITCVENELGQPVDRLSLLHAILFELIKWRTHLGSKDFLTAWEKHLALRGEVVQIFDDLVNSEERYPLVGKITGLAPDGALKITTRSGEMHEVQFGEVRLRPIEMA